MTSEATTIELPEATKGTAIMPDLSEGVAYMDGEYIPINETKISVLDWGFIKSDVTYDVVSVWDGEFFRLEDHLDRFESSCAKLRLTLPVSRDEIRGILTECVRRSGLRESYIEMVCTRGLMPAGVPRHPKNCVNTFFAYAIPYVWILPPEQRERGTHVIVSSVERIPSASVDQTAKNFHWIDLVQAWYEADEKGGDVPVLVDRDGNVTEGTGFNVFAVRDGKVYTPASGVLEGITRKTVIELCETLQIPIEVGLVSADELRDADEVFLSSTAGGVMPVNKIDDRILSNGGPGPLTMKLSETYWAKKAEGWYTTPIDYG